MLSTKAAAVDFGNCQHNCVFIRVYHVFSSVVEEFEAHEVSAEAFEVQLIDGGQA